MTKAFMQSNAKNLYECHVSDPVVEEEKLRKLRKEHKQHQKELDGIKKKIVQIDTLVESNNMEALKNRLQELMISLSEQSKILDEAESLGNITVNELERKRDQVLKKHHDLGIQIESIKMRIDSMMKQVDQIDILIRRNNSNQNLTLLMENIKSTQENLASLPPDIKHFSYKDIPFLEVTTLIGKLNGYNSTSRTILMMGKKSISLYIKLYRDNINIEKWLVEQGKKNLSRINRVDMKTLLDQVFQNDQIISPPCDTEYEVCPYYRLNSVINQVYTDLENDSIDDETLRNIQSIHRNVINMDNDLYEYRSAQLPTALTSVLTVDEALNRLEQGLVFFDLTPFNEFASLRKNYELYCTWLSQLESYQNQVDAYRNSDIAIQIQNKKDLEISISEYRSKLNDATALSNKIRTEMDEISHNTRLISERDRAAEMKKSNSIEFNSIQKKLVPLEKASSERKEYEFQEKQLNLVISSLESEIKSTENQLSTYYSLIERRNKLEKISGDLELISRAVSTKTGIPVIYMKLYLNQIKSIANDLLDIIYNGSFRLSDFNVTPDSFEVPYIKNNTKLADIRYASQSEVAMATMALSFALSNRASNRYNIMLLDEVDGGLDEINRVYFIKMLDAQMDIINSEQVFVISQHIEEMSSIPMDVIQMSDDIVTDGDKIQNVIFP